MAISISISITQNSQSVSNNTSNVTVAVAAKWTNGSYNHLQKSGWLIIDGTKYTFTNNFNTSETTSGTKTLFTKTVNVTHNNNGTKTLTCSASYTSGVSSGTVTASASKTLTTIPRASSLTASNGTLGTAQTLTISRADSSFKHKITYECGSASGYVAGSSSAFTTATSISWTPPISLASYNTTGTSLSATLYLKTFTSDGTQIGSVAKTITLSIPASVKPTCSLSVIDPTGITNIYNGSFVKGLSKFKVSVAATKAYDSPIASYSTTANSTKYTTASFTTDILKSYGTLSISSTVKDKRGRTGSTTVTKTVLNYTPPTVGKLTVKRCNQDGTENDQGNYVEVTYSASVTNIGNLNINTAAYSLRYKKSSDNSFTEVSLGDLQNVYSVVDQTYIFAADSGSSYDVQLTATDRHNSVTRATSASTGFTMIHWRADGTGMGIGKIAEEPELLDIGLTTNFNKPVYGKALGMDRVTAIPLNSSLNDYMEPGCYAIQSNAIAGTCTYTTSSTGDTVTLGTSASKLPAKAGRLEVWSSTGEGIRITQWSYIRQRFIPYNSANAVWERDITRSADNVWDYGDWWRSSLTPSASDKVYHNQKVLWGDDLTSGMYMTEGHTATLSERVSEQANGIALVFCYYNGTDDTNWGWIVRTVPKLVVALEPGGGHTFELSNGKFGSVGTKYLYINDDRIVGHVDNNLTGTAGSGITYANNKFVLRYVLGY